MKILITGANGFVGSALIKKLLESGHEVWALVRSKKKMNKKLKDVNWIEGDLLSSGKLPSLTKMDHAFYLVHGLGCEEKNFEFYESLMAVNFINWVRESEANIIYLGGLGPESLNLSPHLRSRHLTGKILGASGMAVTEFRASIILGEGSLSFEMMKALSERAPFRPDMNLLNRACSPLALDDLMLYLEASLGLGKNGHKIYEIGGPDELTYGELLDLYGELSGHPKRKIKVPSIELKILFKALDYIVPEYSEVGKKLTESLEYPTVVTQNLAKEVFPDIKPVNVRVAMEKARVKSKTHYPPLWDKDFYKLIFTEKILKNL